MLLRPTVNAGRHSQGLPYHRGISNLKISNSTFFVLVSRVGGGRVSIINLHLTYCPEILAFNLFIHY